MTATTDIVVGIGLTGESGYVLEKVVGLAGSPDRVLAVHVLEYPTLMLGQFEGVQSNGEVEMQVEDQARQRIARLCRRFGVRHFEVVRGYPGSELHHVADQVGAGLIAIGTHGRHGWRMLLGDTANAVLNGTRKNVLAILTHDELPEVKPFYSRVLVAVDLSDESREVIEAARRVQRRYDAELHLVTVFNPISPLLTALKIAPRSELSIDAEVEAQLTGELRAMACRHCIPEGNVAVRAGHPAAQVQAHAAEIGADLVVLGTHGTTVPAALFGTMSNDVLHGAHQDILAVRVGD